MRHAADCALTATSVHPAAAPLKQCGATLGTRAREGSGLRVLRGPTATPVLWSALCAQQGDTAPLLQRHRLTPA